tara:strand:- start:2175 stop:3527 length:1353 start_codon:yes stop_codon:yes gene_type:complete
MLKYFPLIIIILTVSCSGSKALLKKGTTLEHNKQYVEASNYYFESLSRNNSNVDALVALNRVGKKVLNQYLNDFYKDEAMGNVKSAVYSYLKASEYQKKLYDYKVYENIPDHYFEKYKSVKKIYLNNLYDEGLSLMEKSSFKSAEINFSEILKFDQEFKDAESLRDISYVEPIYIKGKEEFELKNYRTAYNNFQLVIERISDYKDVIELKDKALELGIQTFLIFSFENLTQKKNIETKISNYISNELSNLNDPFLRLVDRSNFDKIMKEQELSLSGFIDESKAAELGKLLGAQKAISGKLVLYSYNVSKSIPQKRQAAESFIVKTKKEDGQGYINETKFKKVNYTNYSKTANIHIEFHYKLISLETSEVILSDIIDINSNDKISYSLFDGDYRKLYPLSDNGVVKNKPSIKKLRSQFSNNKELKSEYELSNNIFKNISSEVSKKIIQYLE